MQLALDVLNLSDALALATSVLAEIDIIEIGTPMIKHYGMASVRAFREEFPQQTLLADMKTMDAGGWEADMAFDHGADMMTVLAGADDATILASVNSATSRGKEVVADLLGVMNPAARALELVALGINHLGVHTGTDSRMAGSNTLVEQTAAIRRVTDHSLVLAGGIDVGTLNQLRNLNPAILVVGSSISNSANPILVARELRERMTSIWQGYPGA